MAPATKKRKRCPSPGDKVDKKPKTKTTTKLDTHKLQARKNRALTNNPAGVYVIENNFESIDHSKFAAMASETKGQHRNPLTTLPRAFKMNGYAPFNFPSKVQDEFQVLADLYHANDQPPQIPLGKTSDPRSCADFPYCKIILKLYREL